MESGLRASNPAFVLSSLTVQEIEKLQPQISLPIRLAVAPPTIAYQRWWGGQDLGIWSPDETVEIAQRQRAFRQTPCLSSI